MTSLLPGATPATTLLRVRTDEELLDSVPVMLGFHPRDSIVLVLLSQERVQVCARADVAAFLVPDHDVFASLWGRVAADQAVALAYHDDQAVARRALENLDRCIPYPCELLAVPNDAARACRRSASSVAAQAAYAGVRVLPSREALADLFRPVVSAAQQAEALDWVLAQPPSTTLVDALALASRGMHDDVTLTPRQAATLAVALHSDLLAHAVIESVDAGSAERARSLWLDVIRRADPRASAPAHLAVGLSSWLVGDGAMMNLALDRREQSHDDPWFRFLDVVRSAALPPTLWPRLRPELSASWGAGEP